MSRCPSGRISREEIREVYRQDEAAVIALVEGLLDRIDDLEARLSTVEGTAQKNSRNSHKPPSSDGFKKYARSLRKKVSVAVVANPTTLAALWSGASRLTRFKFMA